MTNEFDFKSFFGKLKEKAEAGKKFYDDAKKFYIIAKKDLETSKILSKNNLDAFSVYHLQQCFEKLIKADYIITGRKDPEQVSRHDFHIKMMKEEIRNGFLVDIKNAMASVNEQSKINELKIEEEIIDKLANDEDKLRGISIEEINSILKFLENIEKALTEKEFIEKIKSNINQPKMVIKIKHWIIQIIRFRMSNQTAKDIINKTDIEEIIRSWVRSFQIMIIGIITYPHYNTPRYPLTPNTKFNFFSYNDEIGIVKNLEVLQKYAENYLKNIQTEENNKSTFYIAKKK